MTFDLSKILASKRAYRQHLASLPIEEKLAMLDMLRERTLLLRRAKPVEPSPLVAREESAQYGPDKNEEADMQGDYRH